MKLSTHIRPISYLKSDAARIVTELSESHEPLIITQNGEAKLVVQDVASYEAQQQTMALLKIIALGQREIDNHRFTPTDDAFAALDKEDEDRGE